MSWQDWAVAAIGVALVVWLIVRVVRRVQGKSKIACYGCTCADSCPSARKEQGCDLKKRK